MTDDLTTTEKQIFNSFQITKEFRSSTWSPRPWGMCIEPRYNRRGRVKIYTEEEIILYRMKQMKHTTLCGN